jgi:hypothetical protein
MKLTQENSILLYHYCTEIADALRPILNTKQFDNVDENYWIEKLSEFKNILLQILESETFPSPAPIPLIDPENPFLKLANINPYIPSPLLDEGTRKYMDKIFDEIKTRSGDNRYHDILNSTLQTLLNNIPGYPMSKREAIVTAFNITDEVMAKLKERNQ